MEGLAAAGAAAVFFAILYIREAVLRRRLARRQAELEAGLAQAKDRLSRREFRVERFDLLWFPTLTLGEDGSVKAAAAGIPHCRKCVAPLALEQKEWRCRSCAAAHPDSLADVTVTDAVIKQALAYFHERRP